jgi:hypothetical protein
LKSSRQRLKSSRERTPTNKKPARQVEAELLKLVQTGVEQFILKHATVEEFLKMTRALAEKEKVYSHQLTRSIFSKIVRDAVRKRNPKQTK